MKPTKPTKPTYDDADTEISVTTSWGQMLMATTSEVCVPGISCGARGVALLVNVMIEAPTAERISELTGDSQRQVSAWMKELEGTGYLDWED